MKYYKNIKVSKEIIKAYLNSADERIESAKALLEKETIVTLFLELIMLF